MYTFVFWLRMSPETHVILPLLFPFSHFLPFSLSLFLSNWADISCGICFIMSETLSTDGSRNNMFYSIPETNNWTTAMREHKPCTRIKHEISISPVLCELNEFFFLLLAVAFPSRFQLIYPRCFLLDFRLSGRLQSAFITSFVQWVLLIDSKIQIFFANQDSWWFI